MTVYVVSRDLKPCDQFSYVQSTSETSVIYMTCSFKDLLSQKSLGCVKSEKTNLPIDYTFIFVQVYPFIHYTPLVKNIKKRQSQKEEKMQGLKLHWFDGHDVSKLDRWPLNSAGDYNVAKMTPMFSLR